MIGLGIKYPIGIRVVSMHEADVAFRYVNLKTVHYRMPDGDDTYVAYLPENEEFTDEEIRTLEPLVERWGHKLAVVWP